MVKYILFYSNFVRKTDDDWKELIYFLKIASNFMSMIKSD